MSNDVVINLRSSKEAKQLKQADIIHKTEFEEAVKWIKNSINLAVQNTNNNQAEHLHDTITMLGTRGSGKTTFLLSLREHYKDDTRIHDRKPPASVLVLPVKVEQKPATQVITQRDKTCLKCV